jgi:hypothetical protein
MFAAKLDPGGGGGEKNGGGDGGGVPVKSPSTPRSMQREIQFQYRTNERNKSSSNQV